MKTQDLFNSNKKWVEKKLQANSQYFQNLTEGQSPQFLYIGCCDSRVIIEEVLGANPGDVFVHRNIANQIDPNDKSLGSVLEFTCQHLDIKDIVVCGHTFCGGVAGALEGGLDGDLGDWLGDLSKLSQTHKDQLNSIADLTERRNRLSELNVLHQAKKLEALVDDSRRIHRWIFRIETGTLEEVHE